MTWHSNPSILVAYSMATLDSNLKQGSLSDILRNSTCRKHDFTQAKYPPSRTLRLVGSQAFKDFLPVSSIQTDLGDAAAGDATDPISYVGTKQASIAYEIKSDAQRKVFISIEFGVVFRGLSDQDID